MLVVEASKCLVSSSRGKNNFRGVKKKTRFPRKSCDYRTAKRNFAEFKPLENENCA